MHGGQGRAGQALGGDGQHRSELMQQIRAEQGVLRFLEQQARIPAVGQVGGEVVLTDALADERADRLGLRGDLGDVGRSRLQGSLDRRGPSGDVLGPVEP